MQNLDGHQFGRLTVLSEGPRSRHNQRMWRCLCECGKTTLSTHSNLTTGKSTSCGCLTIERAIERSVTHGATRGRKKSPEYMIWHAMRQRCTKPNAADYKYYGGRGISVCDRWSDFALFLADMGQRPSRAHSIDRKDNDGPYSPENCRWATRQEQHNNMRSVRWIEIDGERKTITQWENQFSLRHGILNERLASGWPMDSRLVQPPLAPGKRWKR